jgi:peroxiredoxin Q/BCP
MFCLLQLKGLRNRYAELAQAGVELATVSADPVEKLRKYVDKNRVPFVMLSDTDRAVIKQYGVYNPKERGGVAIPSVFIINREGVVRFAGIERTMLRMSGKKLVEKAKEL